MPDTQAFIDAIKAGEYDRVKAMVSADPELIDAHSRTGDSAILTAVYHRQKEIVNLLVARGVSLTLFEACAAGELERVERLLADNPPAINQYSADGWTPLHLHYNSGLHVSTNGRRFAELLETLFQQWPVPVRDIAIVGHSSGGLVSRSAYRYGTTAGHRWPRRVRRLVFLGTPHHGSALERIGNLVNVGLGLSRYSAPLSRIASIRSAGITDLRYGYVLDDDWRRRDRFWHSSDHRQPVPLPKRVRCCTVAASIGANHAIGDGLVSVDSALGRHHDPSLTLAFAGRNQWVGYGMDHWDLLDHPSVYERMWRWLAS